MSKSNPVSILIINIRLIGDVVLSTPLLDVLKESYPDAAIDFLVNRGTGEFLEKDPRVRRVHYCVKRETTDTSVVNRYLAAIFRQYDMSICMNASDRGILAAMLAGTRVRIGFYEPRFKLGAWWRKLCLTHALLYKEDDHVALRCKEILHALGHRVERLPVRIFWDESDAEVVRTTLAASDTQAGYCVIHPFARWQYKYWDINRFIELSDHVAQKFGLTPVWTSSPDRHEVELLTSTARHCSIPPLVIPGTFSLNQMACLLKNASVYIGLDTAITHIAASTGIPMVALYGPTEMWRWHPWDNEASPDFSIPAGTRGTFRSGNIVAMQAACDRYPCIRPNCYREGVDNPCMMELSAADVFQEVSGLLESSTLQKGTTPRHA